MDDASYIGLTCVWARHFIDVVWENLGTWTSKKAGAWKCIFRFGHQFRFLFVVWLVPVDCVSRSPVAAAGISAMSTTWCQVNLDSDPNHQSEESQTIPGVEPQRKGKVRLDCYQKWYGCLLMFVIVCHIWWDMFWSRLLFVGPPLWPNGAPKAGGSWS